MKKCLLYIILAICFISCEENVKFNNPSFQGMKDNVFWRAITTTATIDANGALTITAYTSTEQVILKNSSTLLTTFLIGVNNTTTATYMITEATGKTTFSTGTNTGSGQIIITEYDTTNKTISGTFKFNAINAVNEATLNFQQGVFYKVPIIP